MTEDQSRLVSTLGYNKIAKSRIEFLIRKGGEVQDVDEELVTLRVDQCGVEVNLYGEEQWFDW